jgi:hypothetical protein
MKIFLPIVLLTSLASCCSVIVGSKPGDNSSLPSYHESLENYIIQASFGELHSGIKIELAGDLADLLYANFKRVRQLYKNRGKKDEDVIFETDQIFFNFLDVESKNENFRSFMMQPSGYGTMNIYKFLISPESTFKLYNCFANLSSTTVYNPLREPLNDILMISYSFYFLRMIILDNVKFLKFPKVYSHIIMLVSLGYLGQLDAYWEFLKTFLKNDYLFLLCNTRMNDAIMMLKLSSYWRSAHYNEISTSFFFPFSSESNSVEPDGRKFQTIAPLVGMGEPKITLTSQLSNTYSYVLECDDQLYFAQFRLKQSNSKRSKDLVIDHGRHFVFPWISESYIIVALDRLENCDDLELEFKTVVELVQSNSRFLLLYLFNHNLALFRITPN